MAGDEALDGLIEEGRQAVRARDGAQWRLGDLALEVKTAYGERDCQEFARQLGIDYNTMLNYRTCAAAFESSRRREDLSFSHHRELMGREDRHDWIARAAAEGWSVRRLREALAVEAEIPAGGKIEQEPQSEAYRAALAAQGAPSKRRLGMKAVPTVDTKIEGYARSLAEIADRFEDTEAEYLPYDVLETRGAQLVSIGQQMISLAGKARRTA